MDYLLFKTSIISTQIISTQKIAFLQIIIHILPLHCVIYIKFFPKMLYLGRPIFKDIDFEIYESEKICKV